MRVALVLIVAFFILAALGAQAEAQGKPFPQPIPIRCHDGCDEEYPITYDARAMWWAYGYPQIHGGCFWYDGRTIDGYWYYMCPKIDYNLHAMEAF